MKLVFKYLLAISIMVICLTGCTSKERKDKAIEIAKNGSVLTKLSALYHVGDDPKSLARMLNVKEINESNLNSIANSHPKQINTLFNYFAYNYRYSDQASYIRMRSEFDPEWGFFKSIRYWRYLSPISFWIFFNVIGWIILILIFKD